VAVGLKPEGDRRRGLADVEDIRQPGGLSDAVAIANRGFYYPRGIRSGREGSALSERSFFFFA
jgi:hypothetical protein